VQPYSAPIQTPGEHPLYTPTTARPSRRLASGRTRDPVAPAPSREELRWLVVALLPFLVLVAAHWSYGPLLTFADYGQYLSHARALAEGRPYADVGYIYTSLAPFIGPPTQTPGLPLTNAPLIRLFGSDIDPLLRVVSMVFGVAFLTLAWWYLRRVVGAVAAAAAVAFTGAVIEIAFATNVIGTDLGFAAFIWLLAVAVDTPGAWSWKRVAVVTLSGLAALSYRTAAAPMVPALLLYAILRRRRLGTRPFVPLAAWLGLFAVIVIIVPHTLAFLSMLRLERLVAGTRYVTRAREMMGSLFELQTYPFPWARANRLFHLAATCFTVIGFASMAARRQRVRFGEILAVLYFLMLCIVPVHNQRYFWPLVPVFALALGWGVVRVFELLRIGAAARMRVPIAAGVLLAITTMACARSLAAPAPAQLRDKPGTLELFEWVRAADAREPMRVVFFNPRVLTWRTRVPAMGYISPLPPRLMQELRAKRITHVIMTDFTEKMRSDGALRRAMETYPCAFALQHTVGAYAVYRVRPALVPDDGTGCEAEKPGR
jgi:hypothetical protein